MVVLFSIDILNLSDGVSYSVTVIEVDLSMIHFHSQVVYPALYHRFCQSQMLAAATCYGIRKKTHSTDRVAKS